MSKRIVHPVLVLWLLGVIPASADVVWDFENSNDHGFTLWSIVPPIPGPDDPTKAGDEALTGGLPSAGVAWCIGTPDQYDGQQGVPDRGTLKWNAKYPEMVGKGTLNTYALNQHGDSVHDEANDQIATSPFVLLGPDAVLTAMSAGGGGHDPVLEADPAKGYTNNSGGIAVRSAATGEILATTGLGGGKVFTEFTIDLSAFAGQKVYIEVVDAHVGSYGWTIIDEILISNATDLGLLPPTQAIHPLPEEGSIDVPSNPILVWTPGEFAATHNVYFSDSFADVNDGVAPVSPGQDANSYDPGRLEFGQTYFWRVDEINAPPESTVFRGKVWSFTVEPLARPLPGQAITATASSYTTGSGPEKTIDRSGLDVTDLHSTEPSDMWQSEVSEPNSAWIQYEFDKPYKLHQMLVWNYNGQSILAWFGLKDVTITYSTDGIEWSQINDVFAQAPGQAGYMHDKTVEFGGVEVKMVRITANSNWGNNPIFNQYGLSEVQFLHIPTSARKPNPESGATNVAVDATLSWRAGREAGVHRVYLDTDEQSVTAETDPAASVDQAMYSPALDLNTTYYWRVDEVNDAMDPSVWTGDTWSFTTAEMIVVDDFESYGNLSPDRPFQTWLDGIGYSADEYFPVEFNGNGTGVAIGHDIWSPSSPYFDGAIMETRIVHGGSKSLPLYYDNNSKTFSQTDRTLTPAQDWTRFGITSLVVSFYGQAGNTGQLYVKIGNTKILYPGDGANLAAEAWTEWEIDLTSSAASLSSVATLSIGIDGSGASGLIYIDDVLLK
ncbi:MAG: discoidin domain-containing protein [Phycisphaerae bacterium]|nr:discoidin domain-containing protein [Phycisphaerae bacterium]